MNRLIRHLPHRKRQDKEAMEGLAEWVDSETAMKYTLPDGVDVIVPMYSMDIARTLELLRQGALEHGSITVYPANDEPQPATMELISLLVKENLTDVVAEWQGGRVVITSVDN